MANEKTKKQIQDDIIRNKRINKATKRRNFIIVLLIFLLIGIVVTGAILGAILFIDRNSMRIYVDLNSSSTISISKSEDFSDASSVLRIKGPEVMTNISYMDLRQYIDKAIQENYQGEFCGKNYIAFSFYLRNNSTYDEISLVEELMLVKNTKSVASAIRVYVGIQDGSGQISEKIYGQPLDGEGEEKIPVAIAPSLLDEPTTPYYSNDFVFSNRDATVQPEGVRKYIIFIWVEGDDPRCTNDILGGHITLELKIMRNELVG